MKRKIATIKSSIQPILYTTSASIDLGRGCFVDYHLQVYNPGKSSQIFKTLQESLKWSQRQITVFGKKVNQPRLINYQGDLQYTYSGQTLEPSPWHPLVLQLKRDIETLTHKTYNSCLLNYYTSGQHSISWHSDNEPLYGTNPTIATLTLGATRDFYLRSNDDHAVKHKFELKSGNVLVMRGATQRHFMHALPKRAKVKDARVSLTFRNIVLPEEKP